MPEIPADNDGDVSQAVGVIGNLLNSVADAEYRGHLIGLLRTAAAADHHGVEEVEALGVALVDHVQAKRSRLSCQACRDLGNATTVEDLDADRSFEMEGRLEGLAELRLGLRPLPESGRQEDDPG